jgi:hypothetical protein
MSSMRGVVRLLLILAVIGRIQGRAVGGEPAAEGDVFVARLVHPDQQAAEVLRLFEGARWRNPAAALAAWKQSTRDSISLGKPAEALIALFNPEMIAEWRSLDGAELRVAVNPSSGELGWFTLVPRDDGTVAAGIIAMRLTYPDDRPLVLDGRELPVARLGRSGGPLACVAGTTVTVASSRELLLRGVRIPGTGRGAPHDKSDVPKSAPAREVDGLAKAGSGTIFYLEPGQRPISRDAPLGQRRTIEALHALRCRRVEGAAYLKDGALELDVSTTFDGQPAGVAKPRAHAVEAAWLEGLPSAGVMAMVSVAIDPAPSSWDRAFAVADRVERTDPARAGLAPLRSRMNLLAAAAGMRLEADLRPHLRGLSAYLIGDPNRPGRTTGALVVLHLDDPETARRLVGDSAPRVRALLRNGSPDRLAAAGPRPGDGEKHLTEGIPYNVGSAAGRPVSICTRGRDIRIAWGEGALSGPREGPPDPGPSLATLCGALIGAGRLPPVRVGAFWPARLWRPPGRLELSPSSLRVLADDPPVVWYGWSEPDREHDIIRWAGLRERIRGFLATLPLAPVQDPPIPSARIPESSLKTQK